MGLEDFLHLSEPQFRSKICALSDEELRKEEIIEHRKIYGSKCSIGAGAGFALHTGGLSLIGCAVGGRRLNVHHRKLDMIQQVVTSRGMALYQPTKRDKIIPAVGTAVGIGVGMGVEAGVGAAIGAAGAGHVTDVTVQSFVPVAVPVGPEQLVPCAVDPGYFVPVQPMVEAWAPVYSTVPVITYTPLSGAETKILQSASKNASKKAAAKVTVYALDEALPRDAKIR